MPKIKKLPYYQMEPSAIPFAAPKWKGYMGSQGCVALNTQQTVLMDRPAPGEPPPPPTPKPPKPTPEQLREQKAEEARQKALAARSKNQSKGSQSEQSKPAEIEAEECEKPPVFDMLDIPDGMEKEGWPVSAKLSRRWFGSPKLIWDNNKEAVMPINDTSVTLDWVLKFGDVKAEFDKLRSSLVYNNEAVGELKKRLSPIIGSAFQNTGSFSVNTIADLGDLRRFHLAWQFQYIKITNYGTLEKHLSMTDLTGALANFSIYAAIGRAAISGARYYKYDNDKQTKTYCIDPLVSITHVYVYVKDNYSFNDENGSRKTQYLGHWNKKGMILSKGAAISGLLDGKHLHTDMGNSRTVRSSLHWDYLLSDPLDKPVDTRKGMFRKLREEDVYFPIYNKNFNEWRQKHNRGGDFWVCSKPKLIKLQKPIEFTLETLCRPPEKM